MSFGLLQNKVAVDFWCWYHDREVHHQPMIDNNILVLIANKLSEYVENQPGGGGE